MAFRRCVIITISISYKTVPPFIAMDKIVKLYKTRDWEKFRLEQLERDHYECQRCKHRGKYRKLEGNIRYTKATLVHHDFRVRKYPQHILDAYVNGKRNTYSLCERCHEIEHRGERQPLSERKNQFNEEKW